MFANFDPSAIPESFAFGDGIDWSSPLRETFLYVELPFWLMTPPGSVESTWRETHFPVEICPPWMEVFAGEVTDTRSKTVIHQGPWRADWQPKEELAAALAKHGVPWLLRPCKTVLRLTAQAHSGAFRELDDDAIPRMRAEQEAYRASLCEAHIPVVNELIQRYRLITYDFFAQEVSAWDVPFWYVRHDDVGYVTSLLRYKDWDEKPLLIDRDGQVEQIAWCSPTDISRASTSIATPGEFELLDARSLMEHGDYTGAVRRSVTAIEAVLRWALENELRKQYDDTEAERRVAKTDLNFRRRLAHWRELAQPQISKGLFDEFERTRQIRHAIVHRGLRLILEDRGRAERAVDTSRWLFNQIENKPDRATLREGGIALKSMGRIIATPRFPSSIIDGAIVLRGFTETPEADA
jgi:hypothetical protein